MVNPSPFKICISLNYLDLNTPGIIKKLGRANTESVHNEKQAEIDYRSFIRTNGF